MRACCAHLHVPPRACVSAQFPVGGRARNPASPAAGRGRARACWEEEGVHGKQPCFCLARSRRGLCFTAGRPSVHHAAEAVFRSGGSWAAGRRARHRRVGNVTLPPAA